uniref:Signal peptidase complex subunit 3 n=1 Tax=Pyrodinium bahamense TaxID=73915 RepID=A0A7S0A8Z6_9DINO|mmetsp:Transcript_27936/g.76798  ORF Transcript_27936/g.76798 Transcript_27936/m.76798 type:complete len:185 (+) Transcript_27936:61-615(+)
MDSHSARANTIFCTFVTVLGTTAVLNHATAYLPEFAATPTGSVGLNKVHDLTVNTFLNMDQCTLSFNVSHNLTSEFNWNMNQLFVYLVATYNDTTNRRNEVTLWDRIATSREEALLSAKQLMIEYPMRDQYKELRGRDVRLHVRYRTMPITGIMYEKEVGSAKFRQNSEYFRDGTLPLPKTHRR